MNILVDTSVWVSHFHDGNAALLNLLAQDRVLMHPFVLAELACGTPPAPRKRTLFDLGVLRQARLATQIEVLDFVEREKLYGLGCGMVDIHLLASAKITAGTQLWTIDKRLAELAKRFKLAHHPNQ